MSAMHYHLSIENCLYCYLMFTIYRFVMLSYALSSCRPIKSFEGLISISLECCYFEDWKLPGLEFPFKLEREAIVSNEDK